MRFNLDEVEKLINRKIPNTGTYYITNDSAQEELLAGKLPVPVIKTISEGALLENTMHKNIISDNDLYSLQVMATLHRNNLDLISIIAPSDLSDKAFEFNGTFVGKQDSWKFSKYMSYMTNRLRLVHECLSITGVVTVTVSESYMAQTKLLLNEIFGTANYITTLIVNVNKSGTKRNGVMVQHQYILVYAKNSEKAIDRLGYDTSMGKELCYKESALFDFEPVEGVIKSEVASHPYKDRKGEFNPLPLMRSDERKMVDKSYYPVYYLEKQEVLEYDWSPALSLTPIAGYIELLPVGERGDEYKWNVIPQTLEKMIELQEVCIKIRNGKPKLYYKSRMKQDSLGNKLSPLKTILDDGYSNLGTSKFIQDTVGKKGEYFGFNPAMCELLCNVFTKSKDKVMVMGDTCLSFLLAIYDRHLDIELFTLLPESVENTTLYKKILTTVQHYGTQFVNYTIDFIDNLDTIDTLDELVNYSRDINLLKYECYIALHSDEKYDISKDSYGNHIVAIKSRYDLDLYSKINETLKACNVNPNRNTVVQYLGETDVCNGESIIPTGKFSNEMLYYIERNNNLRRKLDIKGVSME